MPQHVGLTILQLRLLDCSHRNQATQPLRFPLFLIDLRAQFVCLQAKLLGVLLEGDKFVPPQITLRHQEIEPTRQPPNLRLQVIPGIDECSSAFADRQLHKLLRGRESWRTFRYTQEGNALE